MENREKSFTLVELMVVISIIGLLSSIIFVSLSNARQKAKIATSLTFSSQVQNLVGIETVGEWSFNGNLNDTFSGFNNNGTWVGGGSPSYVESGHLSLGTAISFDGSHYVQIPSSPSLYPRTDLAVTIEAWVKINSFSALPYDVVVYRPDHFGLVLDTNSLEFIIWGDGGAVQFGPFGIQNTGKWYHVIATFIPPNKIKLYLDGINVFSTVSPFEFESFFDYSSFLYIGGCGGCGYENFNGLIDNVRIYYEPMPTN
jgi:prepilin-type N-terminal cleavage/methylation domain-containing protein